MLSGPAAVRLDIVNDHQDSVHEVGNFLPSGRGVAVAAVERRSLVVQTRCCEHDGSRTYSEFCMLKAALIVHHSDMLIEAKCGNEPVEGFDAVAVRHHRDDII